MEELQPPSGNTIALTAPHPSFGRGEDRCEKYMHAYVADDEQTSRSRLNQPGCQPLLHTAPPHSCLRIKKPLYPPRAYTKLPLGLEDTVIDPSTAENVDRDAENTDPTSDSKRATSVDQLPIHQSSDPIEKIPPSHQCAPDQWALFQLYQSKPFKTVSTNKATEKHTHGAH